MKKQTKVIVAGVAALSLLVPASLMAANHVIGPTSDEIDKDITQTDSMLKETEQRCSAFGEGSLIKLQCQAEFSFLSTTKAMLHQKKASWIRWIDLRYSVEGQTPPPLTKTEALELQAEINKEQADLTSVEEKARNFGGLVQAMALAEAQTKRVSISILRQRLLMRKYGAAIPAAGGTMQKTPVGKSTDDKGAL